MNIYDAENIIAEHTGGKDAWDSSALREVAERALNGEEPRASWSPDDADGLFEAFRLIREAVPVAEEWEAIDAKQADPSLTLRKYADPTEDAREITLEEAWEIAKQDASLIYAAR